ncbi:MAG: inositol monophosphatase [Gemmatimonadetes bacterium]|nr:inositol monophosphatase [Gemmatimonadota bacterium]
MEQANTGTTRNPNRALLASAVAAATRAAELLREHAARRHELVIETKGPSDFVSAADRAAEASIRALLDERHPGAVVIGEEHSPDTAIPAQGVCFVVDPLDGTTNFLHGFPWFAVSIGALMDGAPAAGVVLNVATGELFTATAGGGARRNGQPIHVTTEATPSRALLGTGFPFKHPQFIERYVARLPGIFATTAGVRRAGSAALDLADVACGRYDGFWELMLAPWDIAAGLLIVREAGGRVTTPAGDECPVAHTGVVASNGVLHDWLLDAVRP